jgi:uncharacterized membrane protein
MSNLIPTATVVATVGCGVVGGVFFTFSAFVLPALRALPAPAGIRAMQSINRTAVQPPLMIVLFGTAAVCVGLIVWATRSWGRRGASWTLAAAVTYLVTDIVVTVAANVPRNDALAKVDPDSATAAGSWANFLDSWTMWNHVRTVGGVAACALFVVALLQSRED